jgi:hypothetical protein
VRRATFKQAGALGLTTVLLLGANVIGSIASILATSTELQLLERLKRGELVLDSEILRVDDRSRMIAGVDLALFAIAGIIWLAWQHRSQADLHALRIPSLEYTPGWAVGWWLIPFANLVKPFQTVRELWKASGPDPRWWLTATWSIIGWWWAAWIVGDVLGRFAFTLFVDDASTIDSLIAADRWLIASDALSLIAAIFAVLIVRSIVGRQERLPAVIAGRREVVPPRPDVSDLSP